MKIVDIYKENNGKKYLRFYDDNNKGISAEIKDYYRDGSTPKTVVQRSTGRRFILDRNDINNLKEVKSGKARGFGSGVADDLTFGLNDEILALAGKNNYKDDVERRRAIKKARKDHNPTSYLVGNLTGLATPFLGFKAAKLGAKGLQKISNYFTRNIVSGTRGGFKARSPATKKQLEVAVNKAFPSQKIKTQLTLPYIYKYKIKTPKIPATKEQLSKLSKELRSKPLKKQNITYSFTENKTPNIPKFRKSVNIIRNDNTIGKNIGLGAGYGFLHGFGSGEGTSDSLINAVIGAGLGAGTGGIISGLGKAFSRNIHASRNLNKADKNIKDLLGLNTTTENQLAKSVFADNDAYALAKSFKREAEKDVNSFKENPLQFSDFKTAFKKTENEKEKFINKLFGKGDVWNKSLIKEMYQKLDNKAKDHFTLEEREILNDFFESKPFYKEFKELQKKALKILKPLLLDKELFFDLYNKIVNPVKDNIDYRELGLGNFVKKVIDKGDLDTQLGETQKSELLSKTLIDELTPENMFAYSPEKHIGKRSAEKFKSNMRNEIRDKIIEDIKNENTFILSRVINQSWKGFLSLAGFPPEDSRRLLSYLRDRGDSLQEIEEVIKKANNIQNPNIAKMFVKSYLVDKNKVLAPYKLYENFSQE